MKCADVQAVIEEYLDGELEGELCASLQMHFGNCVECRSQLDLLRSEQRLYRAYGSALEERLDPPGEMWPAIRNEIPQGKRIRATAADDESARKNRMIFPVWLFGSGHWLPQLGFAALLVMVSVAGTLFFVGRQTRETPVGGLGSAPLPEPTPQWNQPKPDQPEAAALNPTGDGGLEAATRAIQHAEKEYLQAIQVLSAIVDQRKSTLQAGLVQEMERNLRSIDESIQATRKAYYSHPSDPYLAQYMLAAYSKKVELLQELGS